MQTTLCASAPLREASSWVPQRARKLSENARKCAIRIRALRAARSRKGLCTTCGQLNAGPTAVCRECLDFKKAKHAATAKPATEHSAPYYLPMCRAPFEQFERGEKDTEYRLAGGRFVARNFPAGRRVVLAKGYAAADSKRALHRTVAAFRVVPLGTLPDGLQFTIRHYLGTKKQLTAETLIACIQLNP